MTFQLNQSLHRLTPALLMFALLAFETSTDIYLPSLPEIGQFFQVTDASVQMTLSSYLLGFSLLGIIAGPLSDSIGRRPVILGGLVAFALGSFCCWMAPTMTSLILARFFQGIGAGVSMVVITAILKDLYDDLECSRLFSSMGMVIALSPMIAPIFGGKIADIWGWKACFSLTAVLSAIIGICAILSLAESLQKNQRSSFSAGLTFQTYFSLIRRSEIVTFALISGLTCGSLWAWIVEAPFYMMNHLGVESVDYGYYAAIGPAAYIVGTIFNRRCVVHYGLDRLLRWGLALMTMGAGLSVFAAYYTPDSFFMLYSAFCIYSLGLSPVFANSATKAVMVKASERGAASALLTALEMGISAVCALSASFLSNGTLIPCTAIMTVCSILCAIMFASVANTPKKEIFTPG